MKKTVIRALTLLMVLMLAIPAPLGVLAEDTKDQITLEEAAAALADAEAALKEAEDAVAALGDVDPDELATQWTTLTAQLADKKKNLAVAEGELAALDENLAKLEKASKDADAAFDAAQEEIAEEQAVLDAKQKACTEAERLYNETLGKWNDFAGKVKKYTNLDASPEAILATLKKYNQFGFLDDAISALEIYINAADGFAKANEELTAANAALEAKKTAVDYTNKEELQAAYAAAYEAALSSYDTDKQAINDKIDSINANIASLEEDIEEVNAKIDAYALASATYAEAKLAYEAAKALYESLNTTDCLHNDYKIDMFGATYCLLDVLNMCEHTSVSYRICCNAIDTDAITNSIQSYIENEDYEGLYAELENIYAQAENLVNAYEELPEGVKSAIQTAMKSMVDAAVEEIATELVGQENWTELKAMLENMMTPEEAEAYIQELLSKLDCETIKAQLKDAVNEFIDNSLNGVVDASKLEKLKDLLENAMTPEEIEQLIKDCVENHVKDIIDEIINNSDIDEIKDKIDAIKGKLEDLKDQIPECNLTEEDIKNFIEEAIKNLCDELKDDKAKLEEALKNLIEQLPEIDWEEILEYIQSQQIVTVHFILDDYTYSTTIDLSELMASVQRSAQSINLNLNVDAYVGAKIVEDEGILGDNAVSWEELLENYGSYTDAQGREWKLTGYNYGEEMRKALPLNSLANVNVETLKVLAAAVASLDASDLENLDVDAIEQKIADKFGISIDFPWLNSGSVDLSKAGYFENIFLRYELKGSDEPTGKPTDEPTGKPTDEPTGKPTDEPTDKPTDEPTDEPTGKPTDEPTDKPTDEPTGKPTDEPTDKPTDEPTGKPTDEPTDEPTGEPTDEPTGKPTDEPTDKPTDEPTGEPTDEPTGEPTEKPELPTVAPTEEPTEEPTAAPTEAPAEDDGDDQDDDSADEDEDDSDVPQTGDVRAEMQKLILMACAVLLCVGAVSTVAFAKSGKKNR